MAQLRQMPYEVHEFPASSILLHIAFSPGRHGGEADAVVDREEQFSIGHRLNLREAQVRYSWVHVLADRGFPAAVIGMADGAMVRKMIEPFRQHRLAHGNRVRHVPDLARNGGAAESPNYGHLKRG